MAVKVEITFAKLQHPFVIKRTTTSRSFSKVGIEENFFNLQSFSKNKAVTKRPTVNHFTFSLERETIKKKTI